MLTDGDVARVVAEVVTRDKCLIISPTGSGKTTKIPAAILRSAGRYALVLVALPTRISAKSAYEFVKGSVKSVDYMTRDHPSDFGKATLIYATSGSVLNLIYKSPEFEDGGPMFDRNMTIIIDEVHNGSVENTIIMSLWRDMSKGRPNNHPRLVLMTATPTNIGWLLKGEAPIIAGKAPTQLSKMFIDDDKEEYALYRQMDTYNKMASLILGIQRSSPIGHILAFVPGKREAISLGKLVSSNIAKNEMSGFKVYIAYGDMDTQDLNRIYESYRGVKIIIATNVAESSITISDVAYVVDSSRERVAGTSSIGGGSLEEMLITKNSANQRAGRAGRTGNTVGRSKYYSVLTKGQFMALAEEKSPDVYRVPIHKEILVMLVHRLSPSTILDLGREGRDNTALKQKVSESVAYLIGTGFVKRVSPTVMSIEHKGNFAATNKHGVRPSLFIWEWCERYPNQHLYACSVVAAMIEYDVSKFISITVTEEGKRTDPVVVFGDLVGPDSLSTMLNLWNDIISQHPNITGRNEVENEEFRLWCKDNFLSYRNVMEFADTLVTTLVSTGRKSGVELMRHEIISIPEAMSRSITVLNGSDIGVTMKRENKVMYKARVGVRGYRSFYMSKTIPTRYNAPGSDSIVCINGFETKTETGSVSSNISVYCMSSYIEGNYTDRLVVVSTTEFASIPSQYLPHAPQETKMEEDIVRMRAVVPEQLGFSRESFLLPQSLFPAEIGVVTVRLVSECLIPSFIKLHKGGTKTYESEADAVDMEEIERQILRAKNIGTAVGKGEMGMYRQYQPYAGHSIVSSELARQNEYEDINTGHILSEYYGH